MSVLSDDVVLDVLKDLVKYSHLANPEGCLNSTGDSSDKSVDVDSMLVTKLDREIDQIETLLAAFRDGVRRKTTILRQNRNLLLPIYRLPSELLAHIFRRVQSMEDQTSGAYRAIKRIAEVSSRWFSTVLSTPYLWTRADTDSDIVFLKSIIYRSGNMPLHIYCPHPSDGTPYIANHGFGKLVIPHAARWKTFYGSLGYNVAILWKLSKNDNLPLLESFTAYGVPCGLKTPEVPEVILQRAPLLHTLSIQPYSFPLEDPVLSRVKKLKFTPMIRGLQLTSHQWHAFLSNSLQLEHLHVVGRIPPPTDDPITFTVILPNLKKLILERLPVSVIGNVISSICVPSQVYPHVEIRETTKPIEKREFGILFPESPQPQSLLWLIYSMTWLSIQCRTSRENIIIKAGRNPNRPVFIFELDCSEFPSTVFETLVPSTGLPGLKSLFLNGTPLFGQDVFIRKLHCFPGLTKLCIASPNWTPIDTYYHGNLTQICHALSSPVVEEGAIRPKWLLPHLTELNIDSTNAFEALISMVESRCRLITSPQQADNSANLKVLRLQPQLSRNWESGKPLDPSLVEKLRKVFEERGGELLILPREPDV